MFFRKIKTLRLFSFLFLCILSFKKYCLKTAKTNLKVLLFRLSLFLLLTFNLYLCYLKTVNWKQNGN